MLTKLAREIKTNIERKMNATIVLKSTVPLTVSSGSPWSHELIKLTLKGRKERGNKEKGYYSLFRYYCDKH